MSDFDLSAGITADASGLVKAGAAGEKAIDGVGDAARRASTGAKTLELATDQVVDAQEEAAKSSKGLGDAVVDAAGKQSSAAGTTVAAKERIAFASAKVDIAETRQKAAVDALALAHARAAKEADNDAEAQLRISVALATAEARVDAADLALAKAQGDLSKAQNISTAGAAAHAKGLGGSSIAAAEAGHAFRAFVDEINAGQSPVKAFAQELPRLAQAASFAGDSLGAVGKFLSGPWGLAITLGVSLLGPFVAKLFEGADAAKEQADKLGEAASSADSYGTAQSLLGKIVDLTTGKLTSQNAVLVQSIKLQAQANILAAQAAQAKLLGGKQAEEKPKLDFANPASPTTGETLSDLGSVFIGNTSGRNSIQQFKYVVGQRVAQLGPITQQLNIYKAAAQSYADVLNDPKSSPAQLAAASGKFDVILNRTVDTIGTNAQRAGRDVLDVKGSVIALGKALNDQRVNRDVVTAASGGPLGPELKQDGKTPRVKAAPKVKADTATPREAEEIKRINEEFDRQPTLVDKAAQATRKLDAIIADLTKRKPPGFEKLIADATTAKETIQDGLLKPFQDLVSSQAEQFEYQKLINEGRLDEAATLKQVNALQKQGPPLSEAQKAVILAQNQALRAQAKEYDNLRAQNAKYIDAIGGIKKAAEDATQAFVRGDLGQLLKTPGKLLDVFQSLQGKALFDKVFGGLFSELEDQVNGVSVVKDASRVYAEATQAAADSVRTLAQAANAAAAAVAHGPDSAEALLARGNGAPPPVTVDGSPSDVLVTARRQNALTRNPSAFIEQALGKVGTSIAKAFTNKETAESIGKSIGTFAGKGLEGAATGTLVAGIGKTLGINLSQSGSQIGGAVGGILGGIKGVASALGPLGAALSPVLSVVGGFLGNLFGSTKYGGATITSKGVTGTVGNVQSEKVAATAAGNAVLGSLRQIVTQLGGAGVGDFGTITVGQYKDKFRVNDHGTNLKSNNDVLEFGTLEEAQAFALQQAIARGAVQGLSAAVSKALTSNAGDVNLALQEALGVKALETALGGVQAAIKATFDTEDNTAKARLRLAQQYGLDIVAVEKYNADQRSALIDSTLKTRIGSLTDFINNLQYGDLAEGSAYDKRSALLDKISGVQADAEAGKDGAADQLAQLYTQLVQNSRDAFGTAGDEYTTDRSTSQTAVERVIAMETARVDVAAGLTSATNAIIAGNDLTSETNDLIAQLIAAAKGTTAAVTSGSGTADAGLGIDFSDTYRFDKLGEPY